MTALPRAQFPVAEHYTYFDHAGVAPITKAAADAVRWWALHFEQNGRANYDELEHRMHRARHSAATLLGVPTDDVAFVKNTTEGLGFVASGLPWKPGDRVVVPDREFPSTIYPWLSLRDLGVQVDLVAPIGDGGALPTEAFEDAIADGPPPKVVATSWVNYGRGWRVDLAALASVCHEAGALLCADVMQGVGVIPADLATWDVDFAVVGAHKWLCAPRGLGVLYVAPRVRDQLRPLEPGWASVAHRGEWDNLDLVWDDSARRFEGGSPNVAGTVGLGASIDVLLEAGIARVWQHVDALCARLTERLNALPGVRVLSDRSGEGRSAVMTFVSDAMSADQLAERLEAKRFLCAPRGGGIRVSPHGYNDEAEVDAFVDAVSAALAAR